MTTPRGQGAGRSRFDIEKAGGLAATSGNRFQCKVTNYFRGQGCAALVSPYYVDSSSDKTRELDLIVEKHFMAPNLWVGPPKVIALRLFIECKYIANGAVFWFDEVDPSDARDWVYSSTGGCFAPDNVYTNEHHYLRRGSAVAKLFQSEKGSEDTDPMFRTVNQCLNGYIHNKSRGLLVADRINAQITQLNYPVVICSSFDQLFRTYTADDPDTAPPVQLIDNFSLEINYAYVSANRGSVVKQYFLLDVLSFDKLDDFLRAIEIEVGAAIELVRDR
jgi:hypothetical protein